MKKIFLAILAALCLLPASGRAADPADSYLLRAVAALYSGKGLESAAQMFKALTEKHPDNDAAHFWYGQARLAMNDKAGAIAEYKEAVRLDPSNEEYKSVLASVYSDAGDNAKAAELYLELLESNPARYSSAYTLTIKGDKYLYGRKDSLAMDCYDKALMYDPEYIPASLGKAEIYRMNGNLAPYFVLTDRFASNPAVNPKAKCQYIKSILGNVNGPLFRSWGAQLDSIVAHCAAAHPADSSALMLAGGWFYGTGREAEGEKYFSAYMEQHSNDPEASFLKLELLSAKDDLDGMIRMGNGLLKEKNLPSEKRVKVLVMLGACYNRKGDTALCFKAYERALKIDPDYTGALNDYAYFLSLEGKKLAKALKMSKKTIDKEPDNPTYLDTFGWILHRMGKDSEAKGYFKHALLYGGKESKEILQHYAEVLSALGETELASYYKSLAENKK